MEVEQKEEWSDIDTSKPESKEEEDKVDFEVEKTSEDKEEKVEAVVEEQPVAETKTETKKEDTQSEEQPDEAKDIESERAQKRIRQLVRQRKEKEEEVARLLAEKQDLQNRLTQNQTNQFDLTKTSIESQEKSLENQLNLAKQNYLDAFEKDDKSQLLKAQEALNEAQINLNSVKTNKVNFDKDYENYQNSIKQQPVQQSQPQQPQYDPKAVEWAEKNEWFGQDKIMTAAALALDAELKEQGWNPSEDDFYTEVDKRLRESFPNKLKGNEQPQQVRQKATSSPSQVVAGTSRTPASKKIKLSQEDVRLANKWNIPLDRYAKEKSKVETGEEYTTITTQMRRS